MKGFFLDNKCFLLILRIEPIYFWHNLINLIKILYCSISFILDDKSNVINRSFLFHQLQKMLFSIHLIVT